MAKKVEVFLNEYEHLKQTVAGNALDLAALQAERDALKHENEQLRHALAKADFRLECENCKHNKATADADCMKSGFICNQCQSDCHCKSCTGGSNWEWNGGASDGD